MKNDKAFTLAEVLITLGIIGIVAALTIPPLIQNYKKKLASVKLKRFYSMMTQAIQLSEIDNGPAIKWTKYEPVYDENGDTTPENAQLATEFYDTYLKNYLKDIKFVDKGGTVVYVYLNDGSKFMVGNGECIDIRYYINGDRSSTQGKDEFRFLICDSQYNPNYHPLTPNKAFGSYAQSGLTTREKALKKCEEGGAYCTVLLEIYDNWEFKDDYPYKL